MKSAIITGASGAIGTALVKYLTENKIKTLVLCRKSSNLSNLPKSDYLKIDYCDLTGLDDYNSSEKYDAFFHLAWNGTYGDARNNEAEQFKNVDYSLSAVRLAKRLGCSAFVGVGSQAEYGRVENGVKLSPSTPTNPITFYGKAKLEACKKAGELCNQLGIKFNWCRVLSIYGIGDKSYTLVSSTILKMMSGEVCDFTPCDQMWDYLYNDDLAYGLYLIAEKGVDKKVYTIGTGIPRPLKAYITDIYNTVGNDNAKCNFGAMDYFENQVMYLCADISELQADTGFEVKTSFIQGVNETVNWYKNQKKD